MYVRFVVANMVAADSRHKLGVVQAAGRIADTLPDTDRDELQDLFDFLNDMLPIPHAFTRSKRRDAAGKALSWYKDSAEKHIGKTRRIAEILDRHDLTVEMLTTQNPGYVVYEDEYQVVAVPFKE